MTQPTDHDYNKASGLSGPSYRAADNEHFLGLLTKNAAATAPSTTFPGMDWIDTSVTPVIWRIRNQADDAWLPFAEIDATDGISPLKEGAAVVSLANTAAFTANQRIEVSGSAANFKVKSDLATGIAASLDLAGENDANEEIIAAALDASVTDDADGSEATSLAIKVLQAGSETTRLTVGATVAVNGTLNATTLQQGGTPIAAIIEDEINSLDEDATSATAVAVPSEVTAGDMNTFEGSSASTWTISSGTAGLLYPVLNAGTAAITFAASGVTIKGALGLAIDKVCSIYYQTATVVYIFGENA